MEKKPTSGHVIGTNAQLQALRPELVKLGFIDRKEANDGYIGYEFAKVLAIYGFAQDNTANAASNKAMTILSGDTPYFYLGIAHHFYTIPENEAPEVSAKKIRDAYYAVNPE